MSNLVGNASWAAYKKVMRDAHDTFNQASITWKRESNSNITEYAEEESTVFTDIELKVLVGFNNFRTWPITQNTNTGNLDNQNMIILVNKQYLGELGYLTDKGYFNFNPNTDYFIHMGIRYKAEGDTAMSQAYDDPLFMQIILRREETKEGTNKLNQL